MQAHTQVGRQGPWGGGPDDNRNGFPACIKKIFGIVLYREFNINGWGGVIVVLNLGFRQSRLTVAAPINGFFAQEHIP